MQPKDIKNSSLSSRFAVGLLWCYVYWMCWRNCKSEVMILFKYHFVPLCSKVSRVLWIWMPKNRLQLISTAVDEKKVQNKMRPPLCQQNSITLLRHLYGYQVKRTLDCAHFDQKECKCWCTLPSLEWSSCRRERLRDIQTLSAIFKFYFALFLRMIVKVTDTRCQQV